MGCPPDPIWLNRWCALELRMQHFFDEINSSSSAASPAFGDLVMALYKFSRKHFYFFYNGFSQCEEHNIDCGLISEYPAGFTGKKVFEASPSSSILNNKPDVLSTFMMAMVLTDDRCFEEHPECSPDNPFDNFVTPSDYAQMIAHGQPHVSQALNNVVTLSDLFTVLHQNGLLSEAIFEGLSFPQEWLVLAEQWNVYYENHSHRGIDLESSATVDLGYAINNSCGCKGSSNNCIQGKPPEAVATLNNVKLAYCPDYPPEYILRVILDQVSHDIGAIERAWYQRNEYSRNPEINKTLKIAQGLAEEAFRFADNLRNQNVWMKCTTPIVFFGKSASIRIIPYASTALISIPYTAILEESDLMIIAHEAAHWIFWRAEICTENGLKTLRHQIYNEPIEIRATFLHPLGFTGKPEDNTVDNWSKFWREEIFADVYGSFVNGTISLLTKLQTHIDDLPDNKNKDDGIYPPSIIRLAARHELWSTATLANLPEVDSNSTFVHSEEKERNGLNGGGEANLSIAEHALRKTAADFADKYFGITKIDDPANQMSKWTTNQPGNGFPTDSVESEFHTHLLSVDSSPMNLPLTHPIQTTEVDEILARTPVDSVIGFHDWKHAFMAEGWGTEGPEPPGWTY